MGVNLTYNLPEERLSGELAGIKINCSAGSGGRAGTKTKDAENWFVMNNPFLTRIKNFGPIPLGYYFMFPHEKKNNQIRLDPFSINQMFGRDGFLIHGRGTIGSIGCIVPYDFSEVQKIYKAVTAFIAQKKDHPVLQVIAVSGDLERKLYMA